jgi:hypothetical protein
MVGAAGAIGRAVQGKDDDTDRPAGGAKQCVIRGHDAVGIVEEVVGVLLPLRPRLGSTYTVTRPVGVVPTNCDVPV